VLDCPDAQATGDMYAVSGMTSMGKRELS